MRIGLLSDTHIREETQALPSKILEAFQGVDIILHAGDIYISPVLDTLERTAPVLAARGDDDYGDTLRDRRVKPKHVLHFKGFTIWLVHNSPEYYRFKSNPAGNPAGGIGPDAPDIIVFGHLHYPVSERHGGILFINPGSPMPVSDGSVPGTVATLHLDSGQVSVDMLQL